jgi:hypothetical protein
LVLNLRKIKAFLLLYESIYVVQLTKCIRWKCTKKCIPYLSGKFSKLSSNKKKGHYGFKAYPYPNILIHLVNWTTYMLPYRSKKAFIFLKFNTKKKGGQIATLNFSKWGGKLSPVTSV